MGRPSSRIPAAKDAGTPLRRRVGRRAAGPALALLLLAGLAPVDALATEDVPGVGPMPPAVDGPAEHSADPQDTADDVQDTAPGPEAAREPAPEGAAALLEVAAEAGTVRVIVTLEDVPAARGGISSASRRAAIARGQAEVLARLPARTDGRGAPLDADTAARARGLRTFELSPGFALDVTPEELEALLTDPAVASVREDRRSSPLLAESGTRIGRSATGPYAGTFFGHTGEGWAVAILDSGVNRGHFALRGGPGVVHEACFSTTSRFSDSLCGNGADTQVGRGAAPDCPMTFDGCGHGTHVASTAAAMDHRISSTERLRSVAHRAAIVSVQVFSADLSDGSIGAYDSDIVAAMEHLYLNRGSLGRPLAAVNLSLGGETYRPEEQAACDAVAPEFTAVAAALHAAGIAVVAASGNEYQVARISWPACVTSVISVGSTRTADDTISGFTNSSDALDLLAPGESILAATQRASDGRAALEPLQGTSMAAPHVAGAFAVLRQADPDATVDELLTLLEDTGTTIVDPFWTGPRIDLAAAVAEVAAANPPTRPSLGIRRGLLQARWSAPARGPLIVTGYEVEVDDGSGWRTVCGPLTERQRTCTIPVGDIDPASWGLPHAVRVRATSDLGPSDWVPLGSAMPFTAPDASAATLGVSTAPGALVTTWSDVGLRAVAQGSPVRRVQVRATPVGGRARTCTAKSGRSGLPSTCTVTRLTAGVAHTVEVRMNNAAGWSAWAIVPGGPFTPSG